MPPKKKAKTSDDSTQPPPPTARVTRASARNTKQAAATTPAATVRNTATTTAKKAAPKSASRTAPKTAPKPASRAAPKTAPKSNAKPSSKSTAVRAAPKPKPPGPVEKWFMQYASKCHAALFMVVGANITTLDPETNNIDPVTFQKWMDDLDVSSEGIFMYYILWRTNAALQMTITKKEFVECMENMGYAKCPWRLNMLTFCSIKSNNQLKVILPEDMASICPGLKPSPNPNFKPFYKWCFAHFREDGCKNLNVDHAQVLFQTLLDADKYSPLWKPSSSPTPTPKGRTPGDFPHVNAFIEYLQSEPRPVAVITKDQYEQFYEFNTNVSWELQEYSENSACEFSPDDMIEIVANHRLGPALIDNYVEWKKTHYPIPTTDAE